MKIAVAAVAAAVLALAAPARAQQGQQGQSQQGQAQPQLPPGHGAPPPSEPKDVPKTLYGVGLAVAQSLDVFSLSPSELETVIRGIRDGVAGKPKFQLDAEMQQAVNGLARARAPKAAERGAQKEKAAGTPYLAKMEKEKGAKKTASGAIVIPEKEGTGASPKESDKVKVNYTGTLVNGRVFDSSVGRGPAEFPLNGVIKCWTEALQTMKVGGKAKVVCPPGIAYGERGSPPAVPGNAVLTFDVELLDIVK